MDFKQAFLFNSINKQSNRLKGITSKEIQLMSNGFLNASKISPSGTNIKSAKSMNGKNKFKNMSTLAGKDNFFEKIALVSLKASIIPLAHLFLCFPNVL